MMLQHVCSAQLHHLHLKKYLLVEVCSQFQQKARLHSALNVSAHPSNVYALLCFLLDLLTSGVNMSK